MPSVVWTKDAATLTWPQGIIRGPHSFDQSRNVTDRLAGGTFVRYELGVGAVEILDFEFPHVTRALLDSALSFKENTVKDDLLTFTHTDNSESPALVKTATLVEFGFKPERYTDPTKPRFRVMGRLQVEPT